MKKNLTELVFILDRSSSMCGLEKDTIGGFNAMLEKQKKEAGECLVTTVLFSDRYLLLHDRIDLRAVKPMDETQYSVGGSTALLDAIGFTIRKISDAEKNTAEAYQAEHVMFVIITDGMENSSRVCSRREIRNMIEAEKEAGWKFIFLGANIDAEETAESYGMDRAYAASYTADEAGTALNFEVVDNMIGDLRTCGEVKPERLEKIRKGSMKNSR